MSNIFFENNQWYHKYRIIDANLKIQHLTKGGFDSKEAAEADNKLCTESYKQQIASLTANKEESDKFFSQYATTWFNDVFLKTVKSQNYAKTVNYVLNNFLIPLMPNNIVLHKITSPVINSVLDCLSRKSMYIAYYGQVVLKKIFSHAEFEGLISVNPMVAANKIVQPDSQITLLDHNQLKDFLYLVYHEYYDYYLEILLGLFAGLRISEVRGLCEEDVLFDQNVIKIQRQVANNSKYHIPKEAIMQLTPTTCLKLPKNNSCRNLELHEQIFHEIKYRIEKNDRYVYRNGLCYENCNMKFLSVSSGGHIRTEETIEKIVREACKKLQLPRITFHGLRHHFASILLEQMGTEELPMISRMLGHKSITTTLDIYCGIVDGNSDIITCLSEIADRYVS